jgi:lipopolysaccharide transport system ATP-binding protein
MYPAIRVSGLSKLYRVGARQQGYTTLRESIAGAFWSPVNRIRQSLAKRASGTDGAAGRRGAASLPASSEPRTPNPKPSVSSRLTGENFWALQDVSFEVQPGEVVGIIGRNGAGKSTLLKILSRITEPTSGRVELRGRVGSLLEVGTGFHPELTGRENIYMNGSILGMSRREIQRKFDEIVAFAEIEDFLDTPVKRYSSGMYVRLAFAVAAHLEPEILIVDEVLAVGDQAFQRKCLGKMKSVASHGRVVLFVSHNLGALEGLCRHGIVLTGGRVQCLGPIQEAIGNYIKSIDSQASMSVNRRTDRYGKGELRFEEAYVSVGPTGPLNSLWLGREAEFVFVLNEYRPDAHIQFTVYDQHGVPVTTFDTFNHAKCDQTSSGHESKLVCRIEQLPLRAGRYFVSALITRHGVRQDHVEGMYFFDVENAEYCGRTIRYRTIPGFVCVDHAWTIPQSLSADGLIAGPP